MPIAVVGAVTLWVGWWQFHGVTTQRMACDLIDGMSSLTGSQPSPTCAAVRSRQLLGMILLGVGVVELVVGSIAASRRGLKAARQGAPWPLRRAFTRAARALDSRIPGYRESRPRISQAWIAGGLFVALVAGISESATLWDAHTRAVRQHHYVAAQRALTVIALPAGITKTGSDPVCSADADTVCARSDQTPQMLAAPISTLLNGREDSSVCDALGGSSEAVPCPLTIIGDIAGNRAVATISRHLVLVKSGKPPAGATRLNPRMKELYVKGSDITIGIARPLS